MSEYQKPAPGEESDRLARALAALKSAPVPEGPSQETLARTLAAVETAAQSPRIPFLFRRNIMFAGLKIAAALLAAAGGVFLFSSPFLVGAPVSFAEVAGKLQKAQTLAYTSTAQIPGQPGPQSVRMLFKEPGHMRCESVPAGVSVVICDISSGKYLTLTPATKRAILLEGRLPGLPKPGGPDIAANEVASFRKLADKKGEPAGEKLIGNVRARGFRVVMAPGYETVVWADPDKRVPVQLDISSPYGDQTMRSTISNIQLDPELDDSLFSLEPPEGYTLRKQSLTVPEDKNDDGSPEAALIFLLRAYAEKTGGSFPERFDNWRVYVEALKKTDLGKSPEAAAMRLGSIFARAQVFAMQKADTHYQPEGVKLGDAGKLLLWRKVKGKETYKAIYGDLHVAELTADQLPAAKQPQPQR
jgi:outer membrane lipoprotein-sorting protein